MLKELLKYWSEYSNHIDEKNRPYAEIIERDRNAVKANGSLWIPWGHELLKEKTIEGMLEWLKSREENK